MKELYELTNPQKSIWVTEEFYKGTSIENIVGIAKFVEPINFDKLKEAINIFIKTNDSFRLKFIKENNEIKQYFDDFKPLDFEMINVETDKDVKNIEENFAKTPLDILDSYLFRSKLYTFKDGHGGFLLSMHHLIVDAWAAGLVISKIIDIYDALLQNNFIIENFISPSYIDYIETEQKYLQSSKFEKDKLFWNNKFAEVPEVASFPSLSQTSELSSNAKRKTFKIPSKTMEFINTFCKENKISPFNFFMGIYGIYLSRVSNLDKFVIGTPILNRSNVKEKHTIGMFISVVPFLIELNHDKSFVDFANQISADFFNIFRHQKYPYQTLLEDLRQKNNSTPNLYNVMLSYQNMRTNAQSTKTKYSSNWIFNGNISDDMEIHFFDINDSGTIDVAYDYKTSKYNSEDIYSIHSRILHIINQIIEKNDILLKEIEIVTPDEKNEILYEFNNTQANYPKDKTIVEIFEEQVEKTPDNIAVVFEDQKLTYRELNEKANSLAHYLRNKGTKSNDVIALRVEKGLPMISSILGIIKAGACYLPINLSYPQDRVNFMIKDSKSKYLLCDSSSENIETAIDKININYKNQQIYSQPTDNLPIINTPLDLIYIIYTSGSTGMPKGAMIMHQNVTRLIKNDKFLFDFNSLDAWTMFHAVSFDFSVWEMYGALLYGGKLVIVPDNIAKDPNLFLDLMEREHITVLNQTPTYFYNLLSCELKKPHTKLNIKYIIFGGEALKPNLIYPWRQIHPNTKLINMYGITETTVHVTFKELSNADLQSPSSNIGIPIPTLKVLLLDKNLKLVPKGVPGEICVCGDGVFKGYLNRPDLNKTKLILNPYNKNELMYRSADSAILKFNNSLEYIGRIDTQVKIRGFRVELGEIEEKILEYPNINSCIVTTKTINNSHDLLCAYYICDNGVNLSDLRNHLQKHLPNYMIPQYFLEVEKWPYNHNGKINKNELPLPSATTTKNIILPRNEIDSKLIDLLKNLLNINNISIDDSFFELGGDSLSAINLCAQIQNEFNVQLFVKDVLEYPQIQELSDIISDNLNTANKFSIKPIEKADYYMVSSAQKRMFYTSSIAGDNSVLYNIPGGIILEGNIDVNKLEFCFNKLIERHESLRTYFELIDGNVSQKIADKINFNLIIENNCNIDDLDTIFKDFVKPFNLSSAPLFRAKFIKFTNKKSALFIDMHHIISDGTSISIFIKELCDLYNGKTLEPLDITYKDFSAFENEQLSSGNLEEAKNYWVNQFTDDIPVLNLPTNHPRPAIQSFEGKKVYSLIDTNTTNKINKLANDLGVTPYMLLLSAYYILLGKYTSQEDIVIGSPVVGRDIAGLYNLIGMFVNTLALKNKVDSKLTFNEFLDTVKQNCLNAYKYQTYPFDELVSKLDIKRDTSRNPLFDTMFTYQNNGLEDISFNNVKTNYYIPDTSISKFDLSLELIPSKNGLEVSFEYATKLFDEDFIKNLSNHYINILNVILENSDIKIADVDILSEEERNKILYEFNNTKMDYPKDKTIVDVFEEQVEKTPDNIAVVFEDQKLTYRELNAKANSIANYLKHNNIGKNDIVPVIMNRSLDLIVSMFGIIKAGSAYLPISAEMPTERINYILENSKAKIVFVKSSQNLVYNNSIKFLDLEQFDYSKYNTKNLNLEIKPLDLLYIIYTSGSTGNPKGVKVCHNNLVNFVKSFTNLYGNISEKDKLLASTNISFDVSIFEFFISLLNGATLYLYNDPNITDIFKYCKTIIKNKITFLYIPPNILEDVYSILCNYTNIPINKMLLGVEPIKSSTIKKYYNLNPDLKIINAYGPTEATICATAIVLDNNVLKNHKIIPIGKPLHNLNIFILNSNLQPVPVGVPGEIYISGDNVSKGYLNNKELTEKNFVSLPHLNCSLAYKTGDLAKWNKDGLIGFIGRNDYQVKINGHRIELGEIESCIYLYPNIDKAIILLDKNNKLICYFSSSKQINIADLKAFLQRKLPLYFIPNFFVQVDGFKLTNNGKIDRKALKKIKIETESTYEPPETPYQKSLVEAFETVLGLDKVGITDNFFELGGDSLLAIKLQIEAFNKGLDLSYKDIFKFPTVKQLSENISSSNKKSDEFKDDYDYTKIDELLKNNIYNNKLKITKNKFKNILLTGSTGYLGSHILDALLKNTRCNIYCLIRAKDNNDPQIRLLNTLRFYFGNKYDRQIFKRIVVIEGDIKEENLGLNDLYYEELGNSIDAVINSAAIVKHYGNRDTFNATNIQGAKNIIQFCSKFKCKLYHLSTLSVSGNIFETDSYKVANLSSEINFNEQSLFIGQDLSNVYIYTKFIAERLILENVLKGSLDAKIIRLGNITNRYSDGIFQINVSENAFLNRLNSFLHIGCIPDYLADRYIEFTPVDSCAEAIIKLILYNNSFTVYHVYNNNHITFRELFSILNSLKINMNIVDKETFNKKINTLSKNDKSKNILSGIINDFDENKNLVYNTNIKIQNNFTNKILKNISFKWPKINEKYMRKYIIYLKSIGYIK